MVILKLQCYIPAAFDIAEGLSMQWHYAEGGKPIGPVSDLELANLVKQGRITSDTLVWRVGMENWAKYEDLASPVAPPSTGQTSSALGNTPNKELMAQGLAAIRGSWGLAIGVFVVFLLISSSAGIISFFIAGPFELGLAIFFLAVSRGSEQNLGMLFSGFNRFLQAFLANLLLCIFIGVLALLPMLILIFLFATIIISVGLGTSANAGMLAALAIPTCALMTIPLIIATYAFSMTFYVLADNQDISAFDAIVQSVKMMRGRKWKLFCLGWRFVGWVVLAFCTCGIGFLWLMPYISTTIARFYDDVKGRANARA